MKATDTHCPYCALQCAMSLTPAEGSVTVQGREFPTNNGGLCQKGWTSASVLRTPDRLTTPLIRARNGELHEASWDAALDLIASQIAQTQAEHGNDAVAVFGGGGLTNEKAYALGKFARTALRTPNIDYNGRFCMASAAAGANRAFGVDRGLPFPLADLAGAKAILLLGSNVAETMPPSLRHFAGTRERGGLLVVDPRHSATATLTEDGAGAHLQPVPGTDLVVLSALLHVIWAEGLADVERVAADLRAHHDGPVTIGYGSIAKPSVADAVQSARADLASRESIAESPRVVVAAYLLAPGFFYGRIKETGADTVTAPLAPDPRLTEIVLDRYAEAVCALNRG